MMARCRICACFKNSGNRREEAQPVLGGLPTQPAQPEADVSVVPVPVPVSAAPPQNVAASSKTANIRIVGQRGQALQVVVQWNRKLARELRLKLEDDLVELPEPGLRYLLEHALRTGKMPPELGVAELDSRLLTLNTDGYWGELRSMPGFRVSAGELDYALRLEWTCMQDDFDASGPQQLAIQAIKDFMEHFLLLLKLGGKAQTGRNIVPPRAHLEFIGAKRLSEFE